MQFSLLSFAALSAGETSSSPGLFYLSLSRPQLLHHLSFALLHPPLSLSSFSPLQATVDDLKAAFAAAKPKFYPSRQRFTLPLQPGERKPVALAAGGKKLSDFGVRDGTELTFNYQLESVGDIKKKCLCGAKNCSGTNTPHHTVQHVPCYLGDPNPCPG